MAANTFAPRNIATLVIMPIMLKSFTETPSTSFAPAWSPSATRSLTCFDIAVGRPEEDITSRNE